MSTQTMSVEEYREKFGKNKKNKFGAKKSVVDGIKFDSLGEVVGGVVSVRVKITGSRDAHAGQEGEVLSARDKVNFTVRIGSAVFVKPRRLLEVLEGELPKPPKRLGKENLSRCVNRGCKQARLKDSRYDAFMNGGRYMGRL